MILPTVLRPQYKSMINPTLSANNNVWDGYCVVSAYSTSLLTKTGGRVRVTCTPPTSGSNLVIASAYIGMAGTAPSFDGGQVQLSRESDGSTGFTLTAGGSTVALVGSFRIVTSGTLLIAFGITSGDLRVVTGTAADYTQYHKAADAANAGTTSKSGYTTVANRTDIVSLIEVLN